jgi:hypothetical protein
VVRYCFSFNLCFALELLIAHQVAGYCFSFWFVFITFLGDLNPGGACAPKVWKEVLVCEERRRKTCRR